MGWFNDHSFFSFLLFLFFLFFSFFLSVLLEFDSITVTVMGSWHKKDVFFLFCLVVFVGIFLPSKAKRIECVLSFSYAKKYKHTKRRIERRSECVVQPSRTHQKSISTYQNEQNDKNSRINMTGNAID